MLKAVTGMHKIKARRGDIGQVLRIALGPVIDGNTLNLREKGAVQTDAVGPGTDINSPSNQPTVPEPCILQAAIERQAGCTGHANLKVVRVVLVTRKHPGLKFIGTPRQRPQDGIPGILSKPVKAVSRPKTFQQ